MTRGELETEGRRTDPSGPGSYRRSRRRFRSYWRSAVTSHRRSRRMPRPAIGTDLRNRVAALRTLVAFVQVGFLAVLRHVETGALVSGLGADRDQQVDDLEQDEADRAAVDDRRHHRGGLGADRSGVAVDRYAEQAVEPAAAYHASEQVAQLPVVAVRRHYVARVVERRLGADAPPEAARDGGT